MAETICEKEKFTDRGKVKMVECAPDVPGSSLFTNCGAITSHYEIDFDKLTVSCNKSKCLIKGKTKQWVPGVSVVKCSRNEYNYRGTSIEAWPAGSITKACGPFYKFFPNAETAGIKASCTNQACFLSGAESDSFYIEPYTKVACQRRAWRVKGKPIRSDLDWKVFSFEEYNEHLTSDDRTSTSTVSCGDVSIWQYIDGYASTSFMQSGAKAKCQADAKGKMLDCSFYCPPKTGGTPQPVRVKFKCKLSKEEWLPKMSQSIGKRLEC